MKKNQDRTAEIKIAFRQEGNMWNAYVQFGSKSGFLLGSIAMNCAIGSPEVKAAFMDLMKNAFEVAAKELEIPISYWEPPVAAPETERGGNA
jgi:hypothetical protein